MEQIRKLFQSSTHAVISNKHSYSHFNQSLRWSIEVIVTSHDGGQVSLAAVYCAILSVIRSPILPCPSSHTPSPDPLPVLDPGRTPQSQFQRQSFVPSLRLGRSTTKAHPPPEHPPHPLPQYFPSPNSKHTTYSSSSSYPAPRAPKSSAPSLAQAHQKRVHLHLSSD